MTRATAHPAMNLHRLDLVSIALFHAVARTGSISAGAAQAHLATAAASKRITDLESALGVTLLSRHSRGVTLTVAGEALQRHAQRILGDVRDLAAELSDHAAGLQGTVRLWANTSAVIAFLPGDLSSFAEHWPGIGIELEEGFSAENVRALRDDRADIGIFDAHTPADGLQCLPYREDRLVVLAPEGHPLAQHARLRFEEVLDFDLVSLPRSTSIAQRMEQETSALGRQLRLRMRVKSFDAMSRMVAAGLGLAVLPADAVQPQHAPRRVHCIQLTDAWSRRQLVIGVRDLPSAPRHVRLLVESLVAGAASQPGPVPSISPLAKAA